jgi:hypothetical protein
VREFLETLRDRVWGRVRYHQWRTPPHLATVRMTPGRTTLILTNGKENVGLVVLKSVTFTGTGVYPEFVPMSEFLRVSRIEQKDWEAMSFEELMAEAERRKNNG